MGEIGGKAERVRGNIRVMGVGIRNIGVREADKLATLVRIIIMTIAIILSYLSWLLVLSAGNSDVRNIY